MTTPVYEPSPTERIATQVRLYEATGGVEGGTMQDRPVVILTTVGRVSGKLRKSPLMRVEHLGSYAVVASKLGAPINPAWYHNLVANPSATLQDGAQVFNMRARQVEGEEKATWWARAVQAWPGYDDYQAATSRIIPVLVLETAVEDGSTDSR